ncbi:MAG: isopentenyl-diphosphate Delta-isomerase [Anaerolineae bacterium]|nr:isopentenyl-diphosphate Delta-isomerase [Anaerolineae bacterium]
MEEQVILVDSKGQEIGAGPKMEMHRAGKLHRAFSVFVFNSRGELLLQQRANDKYHSGGLWTNTCCSHPRPGEPTEAAAHRRLREEMGFDCQLEEQFQFTYRAQLDNGLVEYEYDHVLIGQHDGDPIPSPEEVGDWKWVAMDDLQRDVREHPERYTHWFRLAIERVISAYRGEPAV